MSFIFCHQTECPFLKGSLCFVLKVMSPVGQAHPHHYRDFPTDQLTIQTLIMSAKHFHNHS